MYKSDRITPASCADVDAVYSLLTESFGDSYLKFSVYQSPKSKLFLQQQIEQGKALGEPRFFVVYQGNRLSGFYNAEKLGDEFFLKYIATDPHHSRKGVGSSLLRHFEETALSFGCTRAGLAVFRSNRVAAPWYERRGYEMSGVELFLRFRIEGLGQPDAEGLSWDTEGYVDAVATESERGFSAFSASWRGAPIRLGLIAGDVCNILDLGGEPMGSVANAVTRAFRGRRRWLLMRSQGAPEGLTTDPETMEESLHMVRWLGSNQ